MASTYNLPVISDNTNSTFSPFLPLSVLRPLIIGKDAFDRAEEMNSVMGVGIAGGVTQTRLNIVAPLSLNLSYQFNSTYSETRQLLLTNGNLVSYQNQSYMSSMPLDKMVQNVNLEVNQISKFSSLSGNWIANNSINASGGLIPDNITWNIGSITPSSLFNASSSQSQSAAISMRSGNTLQVNLSRLMANEVIVSATYDLAKKLECDPTILPKSYPNLSANYSMVQITGADIYSNAPTDFKVVVGVSGHVLSNSGLVGTSNNASLERPFAHWGDTITYKIGILPNNPYDYQGYRSVMPVGIPYHYVAAMGSDTQFNLAMQGIHAIHWRTYQAWTQYSIPYSVVEIKIKLTDNKPSSSSQIHKLKTPIKLYNIYGKTLVPTKTAQLVQLEENGVETLVHTFFNGETSSELGRIVLYSSVTEA